MFDNDIVAATSSLPALAGARLDHVGIAVAHLAGGAEPFELLGLEREGQDELVHSQDVHVRTLRAGDVLIELLAPVSDQGAVARFLAKRGPGLHHLAFRVADLDAEIVRLQGDGVPLIDATPRPGIHGTRVVFIHPRFADGVLVELVEHPNT